MAKQKDLKRIMSVTLMVEEMLKYIENKYT